MTEDLRVRLQLCDKEFCIPLSDKTAEKCAEILEKAKERLSMLKCGDCNDEVSEDGICRFLKDSIDSILGVGATDSVFGDRKQELGDVASLMCYIASKISNRFLEEKMKNELLD